MVRIPVACSLGADDATTRIKEWRDLIRHRVVEAVRSEGSARFRLADTQDTLLIAVDLARREKVCCPFFEFHVDLLPEAIWLEVRAPRDADAILDAMVDLRQA